MRIIAGEHRGRIIQAPPGEGTRPMLDRVREALFSTLGNRVEEARVLDLFAGSGSLGLEALSRGATSARMVERDVRTLRLLKANVESLGLIERAEIVRGDANASASWGAADAANGFDLVFFDPPYPMLRDVRTRERVLRALSQIAADHAADGGVLVLHAPRGLLRSQDMPGLSSEERVYGTSALWYLTRESGSTDSAAELDP